MTTKVSLKSKARKADDFRSSFCTLLHIICSILLIGKHSRTSLTDTMDVQQGVATYSRTCHTGVKILIFVQKINFEKFLLLDTFDFFARKMEIFHSKKAQKIEFSRQKSRF